MPKYHDDRILVGVSPNIMPTSLLTSYRSLLIAHMLALPLVQLDIEAQILLR